MLAGHEIAALDTLGAPFWFDLGDFAAVAPGSSMVAQLRAFLASVPLLQPALVPGTGFAFGDFLTDSRSRAPLRLGLLEAPAGDEGGHLALAGHALALSFAGQSGLSATAFTSKGVFGQAPTLGATLSWQPADSPLGLRAGWMGEQETLLGSMARGAFGKLAADAVFVGIDTDTDVAGWTVSASAEVGTVHPQARSGLIAEVSPLTTSAFAFRASKMLADEGIFRFSVSQPLRVERGRATLTVPVARTKAGEVVRNSVSADLAPGGRQINIAAHWRQPLALGEFRLGAVWAHEPGHHATADPELTLLSGWRTAF